MNFYANNKKNKDYCIFFIFFMTRNDQYPDTDFVLFEADLLDYQVNYYLKDQLI